MASRILIVDDDPVQLRILEETVRRIGSESLAASSGEEALRLISGSEARAISLVLLDLSMPGLDGLGVLERVSNMRGAPPVVVQTANGSIDSAVAAMRAGAVDFVIKPVSPERLAASIRGALRSEAPGDGIARRKREAGGPLTFDDLVIRGAAMRSVVALGRRAASSSIPVLIEGQSGVGKELIARAIQGESDRKTKPFVTVNCGAIPENLVESILFGHEKGSFTGAIDTRIGKFEEAQGGTLFLDEVGELPLDTQVKLLRALQDGEIDPVGARKPRKVNFRLISATNRDMAALVESGRLREDLYYRLNVFPISIPPLRERLDDLPELARQFVARFAAEEGKRVTGLSPEALRLLLSYTWPGNVRQLENAVFRAVVLADQRELTIAEFPQIAAQVDSFEDVLAPASTPLPELAAHLASARSIPATTRDGDVRSLGEVEADMIRWALGHYGGHLTEVAKRLRIGRSTLYRKMQEYGLEPRAS